MDAACCAAAGFWERVSRKPENEGEDRSMRVKSERRVFSSIRARFCERRSVFSLTLAAISPSSWLMYSVNC